MLWEAKNIYEQLRSAIVAAKDPQKDVLRDPAIVAPLSRLNDLVAHGYYQRDKNFGGTIDDVHGWKKIGGFHKKEPTNLDMELWQKGNATVATVLSVKDPVEQFFGMGDDVNIAANKISEWAKKYPNLIVVGHGGKGSTAALEAAQRFHNKGLPIPPTLALEPYPPPGLNLPKNAPVVGINMTSDSYFARFLNLFASTPKGVNVRTFVGRDIAGTGIDVARNIMAGIDARGYSGAFNIAAYKATGDRDIGAVVTPPEQPFFIRPWAPAWPWSDTRVDVHKQIESITPDKRAENTSAGPRVNYVAYPSGPSVNASVNLDAKGSPGKSVGQPVIHADTRNPAPARTIKPPI